MNTGDFQFCCGAAEIGNFYGTSRAIKKAIADYIDGYKTAVKEGFESEAYGSLIATTIPSQRSAVTALKSLKFKRVFTFENPNTGRQVTLWAKKLKF